jgi:hypothetical protein
MAESNADEEPCCKRLRFSNPDLKIIVECTNNVVDGGNNLANMEPPSKKVYMMYSAQLANLSNFIDTALSTEMKEKATREIVFHDVMPHIFEQALKYVQDPVAANCFGAAEAIQFAEFYDLYEFKGGVALCDLVLMRYLAKNGEAEIDQMPEDLDLLVEAAAVGFHLNLHHTKNAAITYLKSRMDFEAITLFGPSMFTVDHIRKLQPILQEQGLFDSISWPVSLTTNDVASPLFPTLFTTLASSVNAGQVCESISVSGTQSQSDMVCLDGNYLRKGRHRYVMRPSYRTSTWVIKIVVIDKRYGNWGITVTRSSVRGSQNEVVQVYEAPHSRNLEVPPEGPWRALHQDFFLGTEAKVIRYGRTEY